MPSSDLLFVNKTAESGVLSRSSGSERARIFSHAQQNRPSPNRLLYLARFGPASQDPALRAILPLRTTIVEDKACIAPHGSGTQVGSSDKKKQRAIIKIFRIALSNCVPSPVAGLVGAGGLDPFGSMAVPATPYVSKLFDFYSGSIRHSIFPYKVLADVSYRATLSFAVQDPIACNAILATVSGALFAHSGDDRHAFCTMYFKGEAMHHLKTELSRPGAIRLKISTLYSVALLLWIECLQGDTKAVQAHTRGLEHLVSRVPDIENGPLPIVATILACTNYCAAMEKTYPVLKPPHQHEENHSSFAFTAYISSKDNLYASMASAFYTTENSRITGYSLLACISEKRRYLLFEMCAADTGIDPSYQDIRAAIYARMEVESRLLSMPFDADGSQLTPSQNAIRLALYVLCQPITALGITSSAFNRSLARQLEEALDESQLTCSWENKSGLLIWVLFITAHICVGQQEWPWLLAEIRFEARRIGLDSREKFTSLLCCFFYFPRVFGVTLAKVWEGVEAINKTEA